MGPTRTDPSDVRTPRGLVARLGRSPIARESSWALAAELARMVTQLATFLVITALFDARDYGTYVGAIGLLSFLFPFTTLGAGYVLLQRIAGQRMEPGRAFTHAVSVVVIGGLVTTPVLVALRPWLLPQLSITVLVLVALGELVFAAVQDAAIFVLQATHRVRATVPIRLAIGLTRLVAVLVLWATVPTPTLAQLTGANLLAMAAATATALWLVRRSGIHLGRPGRLSLRDATDGLPFALGFGADKLRESADSVLLVRLDRQTDAGIYGASTRLVDMAVVPIRALSNASNARFFEAGHDSVRDGCRVARHTTSIALAYAIPVGVLMALLGPTAITLLPSSYQSAGEAVRILALWPVAVSIEMFAGTALAAIGHQRTRVVINLVGAAVNIGLNLLLIPDHGWRGSVAATLTASVLSSIVMWTALGVYGRRERPTDDQRDASAIARS